MTRVLYAGNLCAEEVVGQLRRPGGFLSDVRDIARSIVTDVRKRGDEALLEYSESFDGVRPEPLRVLQEEIEAARSGLDPEVEESFRIAIENVRAFHEREMDRSWEIERDGGVVGQRIRPLRRVGLYVPGGHGAYRLRHEEIAALVDAVAKRGTTVD